MERSMRVVISFSYYKGREKLGVGVCLLVFFNKLMIKQTIEIVGQRDKHSHRGGENKKKFIKTEN